MVDSGWNAGIDWNGLPGDECEQHHGLCAGAVQLLYRAAVRDGGVGNALEAGYARGWVLGLLAGTAASIGMFIWVQTNAGALRYIAMSPNAKPMAENLYRALWSWLVCVGVTVVVSLMTKPVPIEQLSGLVYGATPLPDDGAQTLWQKPSFWAIVVIVALFGLNLIFF